MRNKILTVCAGICLLALTGCEKELMTYEGKDCIYFDVRKGAEWIDKDLWSHEFYSTVSFGSTLDDDIPLSLKVQASGMPADYDREFSVVVAADSTELQSGDFDGLASTYVIKAGETSTNIDLTFHRTEHMYGDTLLLQLQLVENEHFSLMYTDFGKAPEQYDPTSNPVFDYNHDASVHNIFVFDVMSRPKQWAGSNVTGIGSLGAFSAKKWKLIMELTGTTIDDFSSAKTMPSARMAAIGETLARYLIEKAIAREPVLDEDGTMMYCNAVSTLGGSNAWAPFTTPEEYYQ